MSENYPRAAFRLGAEANAFGTGDDGRSTFRLNFATGKRIASHWMFKNLYVDLEGIEVDSERQPVLLDHQHRVGASTSIELTDEGFIAEGVFLKNRHATELVDDAKSGFPFRCSCEIPPDSIEFVEDGALAQVNGEEVTGPATIWRQSRLNEITITATPADRHTRAEIFDNDGAELVAIKTTTTRFEAMADEDIKKEDEEQAEEELATSDESDTTGTGHTDPTDAAPPGDAPAELADDEDAEDAPADEDADEAPADEAPADEDDDEEDSEELQSPASGDAGTLGSQIAEVLEVATPSQHTLAADLIRGLTKGETTLAACFKALAQDPRRFGAAVRAELEDVAPEVVVEGAEAAATDAAVSEFDAACQQEWDADPALAREFGEFKFYHVHQAATRSGGIR
jgi:hypothetical protein